MKVLPALVLTIVAACTPQASPSAPPAPSVTATRSTAPTESPRAVTINPGATAYTASTIYESQTWPTAIAATDTQIFVGLVSLGAKPSDTQSKVAFIQRRDGTEGIVLGSERPQGVSISGLVAHAGALYFSSASGRALSDTGVWRAAGGLVGAIAGGPGSPANLENGIGDGGPATSAALQGPAGLAFGPSGDLYIAEASDSRIRVVRAGTIATYAGGNGVGLLTEEPVGSALVAKLGNVDLVAAAPDGTVYAAQSTRSKWIARIAADGTVSTISDSFAVGGLAIGPNGDLLASDTDGGRVVQFPKDARDAPVVLASGLAHPTAMAAASDGAIYVITWRITSPGTAVTYQLVQFLPRP